ncbi:MAG: 16S rRNA (guanine(966)-N(2))-methyltransferase RsmD [Cyanobacteria bacterium HKST-UBA05]|nr:16S rRNA (guanine(966)-N(2))-methyltransferase RsmD [Cyanobacteria bacterium HKST-UBA05]
MIRLTGGSFRGRKIGCPKGKAVRPTTAFVRESLFSILGPGIKGCHWLDVFAGCGIVGFEALSRGAAHVVAIEKAPAHAKLIEQNREALGIAPSQHQTLIMSADDWLAQAAKPGRWQGAPFDVIWLDPPFAMDDISDWIATCLSLPHLLNPEGGVVIWEHRDQAPTMANSQAEACMFDRRHYSTASVSWFRQTP